MRMSKPGEFQYEEGERITTRHIFKIRKEELEALFKKENLESRGKTNRSNSITNLSKFKFAEGLCNSLASDPVSGIIGDSQDIHMRKSFYGTNDDLVSELPGLIASFKETLKDKIFFVVFVAAILSILIGEWQDFATGWEEGTSIILTLLVIVFVQSYVDYYKDKRLIKLQTELKNDRINVYRGKKGVTCNIPYHELLVGDIVELEGGMRVPADCVLVQSRDITCDESYFEPKDVDAIRKIVRKGVLNE
jgi:magnesium-transporting ATPase (P-type)